MGLQTNFVFLKYIFKNLKKYACLGKISKFGFDAQCIPVVKVEPSKFYTGVFSSIHNIFEGVAKIL